MNRHFPICPRCCEKAMEARRWKMCDECRAIRREENRQRRKEARETGKCMNCHEIREPEFQDSLRCRPCAIYHREAQRLRREQEDAERICRRCKETFPRLIGRYCTDCRNKNRAETQERYLRSLNNEQDNSDLFPVPQVNADRKAP